MRARLLVFRLARWHRLLFRVPAAPADCARNAHTTRGGRERDMGAVPSSAKARKLNPIIVALKFPFAIVGMLVLFVLAIPEGFLRVVRTVSGCKAQ